MSKITEVLRWIGIITVIILAGWLAYAFKVNVGGLLGLISGDKKKRKTAILNTSGEKVGVSSPIIIDLNPLRDKTTVTLESGDVVQLPKGVKDKDVKGITKIGIDEYEVEVLHAKLSDVFDTD